MTLQPGTRLAALFLLIPGAAGQVAPGEVIVAASSGYFLADRSGALTRVGGGNAAGSQLIDPIDSSLWSAGLGGVIRARMQGTNVVSLQRIPAPSPTDGCGRPAFDDDLNLLLPYFTYSPDTCRIFRCDRGTGAFTPLWRLDPSWTWRVSVDPVSQRVYYFYSRPPSFEVRFLDPPYTGPDRLITLLSTVLPPWDTPVDMVFSPTGPAGELFVASSFRFSKVDLATGAPSVFLDPRTTVPITGLTPDRARNDFWFAWGDRLGNLGLYTLDRNGAVQPRVSFGPISSIYSFAVNDYVAGTLFVAPARVPTGAFTLEIGLWGTPGHLGVVAMTKPFATILAVGTLDRSGNLPIKVPVQGGVIQPGNPGQIDFLGASIDPQTLAVILTPTRSWPKN